MITRYPATSRGPARRHRPARRVSPAKVLAWILKTPEEDRLQLYAQRWVAFQQGLVPFRARLARTVEEVVLAASRVLGDPPEMTQELRDQHIRRLAESAVARYWRRRPCPSLGGPSLLLPRVVGGDYFGSRADAVHWLDLDTDQVAEAFDDELKNVDNRTLARRHQIDDAAAAPDEECRRLDLLVLVDELRNRLLQDPVVTVAGPPFQRVHARLTALAWRDPSPAMRRFATKQLEMLARVARPDLRSDRTQRRHRLTERSREERERKACRIQDIREHQETFAEFCAEQTEVDSASVPPPLRARRRPEE